MDDETMYKEIESFSSIEIPVHCILQSVFDFFDVIKRKIYGYMSVFLHFLVSEVVAQSLILTEPNVEWWIQEMAAHSGLGNLFSRSLALAL